MNYLFVHFKEKRTPDGEQVYFGLSKDGYHWERINDGQPVLWSMLGEKGVRDFTICRGGNGHFYILATDLSLSYEMRNKYKDNWLNVKRDGSHQLMMWESEDLVHWSAQKALPVSKPGDGCNWAPDIIWDEENKDFVLHWSSPDMSRDMKMCIYYCRTKDFVNFTEAQILYEKEDSGIIDSCIVKEKDTYYLWVKSEKNPVGVIMLKSNKITGPYERMTAFDAQMEILEGGAAVYEAPTACRLEDGSYNLFLDYFGVRGKGQGYVSFKSSDISSGVFVRSDADFSYPYGFKHGTILPISDEEYDRIKGFDFEAESYNR